MPRPDAPQASPVATAEAGMTVIELVVAAALALLVALALYDFVDSSNREYVRETDYAAVQSTGRATLDVFASDLRHAGHSPIGLPFYALTDADATAVRMRADLDGDGVLGTAGLPDETIRYRFVDPDADGLFDLQRGIDIDGDGSFSDAGESLATVARRLVPVDYDGDGTDEPFLAYDTAPPTSTTAYDWAAPVTSRVTITFGVQSQHKDVLQQRYRVLNYRSDVSLRNR